MRLLILFVVISSSLLFCNSSYTQTVKGIVKDTLGKRISFVNISLKSSDSLTISFTSSDENGDFIIAVPTTKKLDTFYLEASSLGYKKKVIRLKSAVDFYTFIMVPSFELLDEVIIKDNSAKIIVRGDTTNYKVADFSSPQDRVIGDVLKRLPGINVSNNGEISYNGKAISGFYIDGDNLLDDRYNLATTTVPNEIVENVQVIENHQPIKVLRSGKRNDDVALNITFKKDAKLKFLGKASIAGGFPGKYDTDVDGMTFKNRYKAINSIKSNNIGTDVALDLISHNAAGYVRRTENNKPQLLLSSGTAGAPDLPKSRYLFNQSLLFNVNNLVKLNKDVQIKANISYFIDNQRQQYQKYDQIYLTKDTITYNELQDNRQILNNLNVQLNMEVNKANYHLTNTFLGNISRSPNNSYLTSNALYLDQNLKSKKLDFSNELAYLKKLKNTTLLNFYSYTNHITRPELLAIAPGLNPDFFNSGQPYKKLEQQTNIPTLVTNNYISVASTFKKFSFEQKIGFSIQSQSLKSALVITQNNGFLTPSVDSSSNNLTWLRNKFYTTLGIGYSSSKAYFNLSLPLSLQLTTFNEKKYDLSQSLAHWYISPNFQFKYQTGKENYLSFNYNLMNNVGDINEVYRGYILKNYRTFFSNSSSLTEQRNHNFILGFFYRKGIKMLFYNLNIFYSDNKSNNITSSIITPNFQRSILLPFNNIANSWGLSGTISKYLFFINTTASINPDWKMFKVNLLQNGSLFPVKTQSTSCNISLETRLNTQFSTTYTNYFSYLNSVSAQTAKLKFSQSRQYASINYSPIAKLTFRLSADYYLTREQLSGNQSNFFADLKTQYSFPKRRISCELNALNLLNYTKYSSVFVSSNMFSLGTYDLPGRIIMGKVVFTY